MASGLLEHRTPQEFGETIQISASKEGLKFMVQGLDPWEKGPRHLPWPPTEWVVPPAALTTPSGIFNITQSFLGHPEKRPSKNLRVETASVTQAFGLPFRVTEAVFKHGSFFFLYVAFSRGAYVLFTGFLRCLFTGCLRPLTKGLSHSGRGSSGN